MKVKFWGTRGSIPVPGIDTIQFGGNTPCVEVRSVNDLLILDAGSGIRELGNILLKQNDRVINILLTHYHWDHIQGIPFFKPLYDKNFKINFYGLSTEDYSIESLLSSQMYPINFPISIDQVSAEIKYETVLPNSTLKFSDIKVDIYQAIHPTPTLIYKLSEKDKSIIYMTDNELNFEPDESAPSYRNLIEFCKGCDYLIHDSMFDENAEKRSWGWGHSSNISLALFAIQAKVKNIVLFHYNPDHDDRKLEFLLNETIEYLGSNNSAVNCIAAREGLEIQL